MDDDISLTTRLAAIRKKAFEEEVRLVIPEFVRVYSKEALQHRLEKYLDKFFSGYMEWHFQIDRDNNGINFQINHPYSLDYTAFTVVTPA